MPRFFVFLGFWVALRSCWPRWRSRLLLVKPATVVAWHRRILHFNATFHPTAAWVVQQLREAFPFEATSRYLIFDRDSIFSAAVVAFIKRLGIKPCRTAYRSPVAESCRGALGGQLSPRAARSRRRVQRAPPGPARSQPRSLRSRRSY